MQMYGMNYYGICNRLLTGAHRKMATIADGLDMKDFLHSNSPYKGNFIRPAVREVLEIDLIPSVSPDDVDNLSTPSHPGSALQVGVHRQSREEPRRRRRARGVDVNEYGTNVGLVNIPTSVTERPCRPRNVTVIDSDTESISVSSVSEGP